MTHPHVASRPAQRKRRRALRFSLRTLLVTFTLCSLGAALFFNNIQVERRAAEIIREAGGEIVYDWQIRPSDADPSAQLAPPGPNWLRQHLGPHWFDNIAEVHLMGSTRQSGDRPLSAVLSHLAKLKALKSLELWDHPLDHAAYQQLGSLHQLQKLYLWQTTELSPVDAAELARASGLRALHLDQAISSQALNELAKLASLEVLDVDCTSYDSQTGRRKTEHDLQDDAAHAIATFPHLRSVMLFATQITDDGMGALSRLSNLETLVVSSPHITSASFDQLAKLKHLEHLGTWQWKIDDEDFSKLSAAPRLRSLALITPLTDECAPHIAKLRKLRRLSLYGEAITDEALHHLHRLNRLEWLDVKHTSVKKHGHAAMALQEAFPNCNFILPHTEREKEMESAFHNQKWGGGAQR